MNTLRNLLGPLPDDNHNQFKRRMRIHQGWWRTCVLAEEPGQHPQHKGETVCNTISDGERSKKNFLTKNIKNVVDKTLTGRTSSSSGIIRADRLYNNLLSSQPMCFNLFGELSVNTMLATRILGNVIPDVTNVRQVKFEYAPTEKYTGDNSAFDVAIEVESKEGIGLIGLECKYTDDFTFKNEDGVIYGAAESRNHETYKRIFGRSGSTFLNPYDDYAQDKGLNQLFRNQLIAESLVKNEKYKFVITGLVCHQDDDHALESGKRFQQMLHDGEKHFVVITLKKFIEAAQRVELDWDDREWTMLLWARYCGTNFSKELLSTLE